MRRASRNTPLWILIGAAVVVAAATVSTRAGGERSDRPAVREKTSPAKAAPVALAADDSAPNPAPLKPLTISKLTTATPSVSSTETSKSISPSSEPVGVAGMVVGIDPETGKLGMPSREFRDAMRNNPRGPALSRSMEGLQVIHRPDGSKMVDLKDRFQDYAIIRIAPDGRKEQTCVQGPDVEAALAGKPAVATPEPAPADPDPSAATDTTSGPAER